MKTRLSIAIGAFAVVLLAPAAAHATDDNPINIMIEKIKKGEIDFCNESDLKKLANDKFELLGGKLDGSWWPAEWHAPGSACEALPVKKPDGTYAPAASQEGCFTPRSERMDKQDKGGDQEVKMKIEGTTYGIKGEIMVHLMMGWTTEITGEKCRWEKRTAAGPTDIPDYVSVYTNFQFEAKRKGALKISVDGKIYGAGFEVERACSHKDAKVRYVKGSAFKDPCNCAAPKTDKPVVVER